MFTFQLTLFTPPLSPTLIPDIMSEPFSAPASDASVEVNTRTLSIDIESIIQHSGSAEDFFTMHEHFFEVLDRK